MPIDGWIHFTPTSSFPTTFSNLGALVYHRQRMTDGRFTHVSPANGDYSVCFNNAKGFDTKTVTFNFKKGIAAMTAEEVEDLVSCHSLSLLCFSLYLFAFICPCTIHHPLLLAPSFTLSFFFLCV